MTDRYIYRVMWSVEDDEYIGLCTEFPSLSWLAPTPDEAFSGIGRPVSDSPADMRAANETAPKPMADRAYSGKFMVRVPPETHRALAIRAVEEGVSLNRLVSARLTPNPPMRSGLGVGTRGEAVGCDGPRSIPINGAGGGLWLSLGAPMAVLGSGAGVGSAGQHAGEDNRGPGRCDSMGRLGSLVDGSGAVGAVRQAMQGSQSSQGTAELGFPGPMLGQMQSEAAGRAGEPSGQGEEAPPEGLGGHHLLAQTDARGPAGQVMGITWTASHAPLAGKRPEGRWLRPTPCLRSRMAFSISAWRRWSASSSRVSPSRSVMKP